MEVELERTYRSAGTANTGGGGGLVVVELVELVVQVLLLQNTRIRGIFNNM